MKRRVPFYRLVTEKEITEIHEASLRVLNRTGIKITHEETLSKLEEVGAQVDRRNQIVKFPRELVEEAVQKTPKSFTLAGRHPKKDVLLRQDTIHARPTGGPDHLIDLRTDRYREITLADVAEWAVLVDALENINYVLGIYPNDVPLLTRDVRVAKVMLENTTKHIQLQPYSGINMRYIALMAEAVVGSKKQLREKPLVSIYVSSLTPLQYRHGDIEILKVCGEYGIPVMLNSSPIAGATAPVTLAGLLVLLNAEILAGNVIMQNIAPGSPVVYTIRPLVFDMSTSITAYGYAESSIAAAVAIQLAREKYGFLTDVHGPRTDSKTLDGQATLEKAFATPIVSLAGANIISGAGMLESDGAVSPTQLVIDNDLIGMTFRVLEGFKMNDERLAIPVIDAVGPGGHFLDSEHTFRYFREEYYRAAVLNRESREIWENHGCRKIADLARNKALDMIRTHQISSLDKVIRKELDKIVLGAEKEIYRRSAG